jgi:hypothetical protein
MRRFKEKTVLGIQALLRFSYIVLSGDWILAVDVVHAVGIANVLRVARGDVVVVIVAAWNQGSGGNYCQGFRLGLCLALFVLCLSMHGLVLISVSNARASIHIISSRRNTILRPV